MLKVVLRTKFQRDFKRAAKRGRDLKKLEQIMDLLAQQKQLPKKHRNHKLKGNLLEKWECHVEPDWLLIYEKTDKEIIFCGTGTHSDLFE